MKRIAFCWLVSLISAYVFACDIEAIVSELHQLESKGRLFSAITLLEENKEQCKHPRLNLELGNLYLAEGASQKAISIWQQALDENTLPKNVATNVKLKIIKTKLLPEQPFKTHLIFGFASQYHSTLTWSSNMDISGFGSFTGRPTNIIGYAIKPSVFAQFSGTTLYYWAQETSLNHLVAKTGLQVSSYVAELSTSVFVRSINEAAQFGLQSKVRLGPTSVNLTTDINWPTADTNLKLTESLNITNRLWATSLSTELSSIDEKWQVNDAAIQIKYKKILKPAVTANYNFIEGLIDTDLQLRLELTKSAWLSAKVNTTLNFQPQWKLKVGLHWRPF